MSICVIEYQSSVNQDPFTKLLSFISLQTITRTVHINPSPHVVVNQFQDTENAISDGSLLTTWGINNLTGWGAPSAFGFTYLKFNGHLYRLTSIGAYNFYGYFTDQYGNKINTPYPSSSPAAITSFEVGYLSDSWRAYVEGTGNNTIQSLALQNDDGGVYVSGQYGSVATAIVNNDNSVTKYTSTASPADGNQLFIAKYDKAGFAQWVVSVFINGYGQSFANANISVDSSYNTYITSAHYNPDTVGTITNGNGATSSITIPTSAYSNRACLIKFDSAGSALWYVRVHGNGYNDWGFACACDAYDNSFIAGYYLSPDAQIYDSNGSVSSITLPHSNFNNTAYVVKYSKDGSALWRSAITATSGFNGVNSMCVDNLDNVYYCGFLSGYTHTLYDSTANTASIPNPSGNSGYVVKLNSSGVFQWRVLIDSASNDETRALVTDKDQNLYFTGYHGSDSASIYDASGTSPLTLPAVSNQGCFLVKFNSSGVCQWRAYVDGANNDSGYGIDVDRVGNVYICGVYGSEQATIYNASGETSGLTLPAVTNAAAFCIKYNSVGSAVWRVVIDGASNDAAFNVKVDSQECVYVSGQKGTGACTIYNATGISAKTLPATAAAAGFTLKFNSYGIC